MMAHMVMRGQKPVVTFKHSLIIMEAPSLDQASQREEWTRDSDEGGTLLLLVSIQCVLLLIVTVTIVNIRMRIIYDKSRGKQVCEQTEKM